MQNESISKEITETKFCPNCQTEKPLKSFSAQKRKDGTFSYSKNCNTCRCILTRIRKHGIETLQKPSPYLFCEETMRQLKICSCCKGVLTFDKFSKLHSGITSECSACRKEKSKDRDYSESKKLYIQKIMDNPVTREKGVRVGENMKLISQSNRKSERKKQTANFSKIILIREKNIYRITKPVG